MLDRQHTGACTVPHS